MNKLQKRYFIRFMQKIKILIFNKNKVLFALYMRRILQMKIKMNKLKKIIAYKEISEEKLIQMTREHLQVAMVNNNSQITRSDIRVICKIRT